MSIDQSVLQSLVFREITVPPTNALTWQISDIKFLGENFSSHRMVYDEKTPMNHPESHLSQVIDALKILNSQEPLDAKTLAELIDLSPQQTSRCLSVLHHSGYLAKVGTHNRYACFILKKPLKARAASVRRAYKNRLTRRKQRDYKDIGRQIANQIAQAAIRGIERELGRQVRLTTSAGISGQLPLFGLAKQNHC